MSDNIPFIDRVMARIEAFAASFHVDGVVGDTKSAITKDHRKAIRRGIEEELARRVEQPEARWLPIQSAPRDGTNILLRFGVDGVSQGKYVPGTPHPWKFIDTNDGITWLVNHAIDGPGGPSHYMLMPSSDITMATGSTS
jgi:hypothetical protein